MMAFLFLLLSLSIAMSWFQYYRLSIGLFMINLFLSLVWFFHHASSSLSLHF